MTADNDSGGRQRQRMMTARKIRWWTMRGKEESGRQTTTALGPPGREREKVKKSGLRKKLFSAIQSVWLEFLLLPKTNYPPFRFISHKYGRVHLKHYLGNWNPNSYVILCSRSTKKNYFRPCLFLKYSFPTYAYVALVLKGIIWLRESV